MKRFKKSYIIMLILLFMFCVAGSNRATSLIEEAFLGGINASIYAIDRVLINSENSVEVYSSGDILLRSWSGDVKVWLPTSKGGREKIECVLWFNPLTNTLKATPINKVTCGGLE